MYVCLRVHNGILTKLYTLEKSKKMNKLKLRRRIPYKTKFDDEKNFFERNFKLIESKIEGEIFLITTNKPANQSMKRDLTTKISIFDFTLICICYNYKAIQ